MARELLTPRLDLLARREGSWRDWRARPRPRWMPSMTTGSRGLRACSPWEG